MNILKKKMIWFGIFAVTGIALSVVDILRNMSTRPIAGLIDWGLTATAIIKLIQFHRFSKNPQLLKRYEIKQKEERLITIAEKSGRFTFKITMIVEFISIFILVLIGKNVIATTISTIAGIQMIVYLIIYYYLQKKY